MPSAITWKMTAQASWLMIAPLRCPQMMFGGPMSAEPLPSATAVL